MMPKMKRPYDISAPTLKSIISISEKIGEISAKHLTRQPPRLRKREPDQDNSGFFGDRGDTLSEQQIHSII